MLQAVRAMLSKDGGSVGRSAGHSNQRAWLFGRGVANRIRSSSHAKWAIIGVARWPRAILGKDAAAPSAKPCTNFRALARLLAQSWPLHAKPRLIKRV
jgi:hypothetical protein